MQAEDRLHGDTFRPDLEGLRGVAILLVLLFHAGLPGTGGGFVGVDVFFVLSGFLITGLLVRERERSGRIDLRAFYARRARRILPAAAVVIVATLAASWFILAPLDLPRVAADGAAAALSVGNIRFAANAMDYFAPDAAPSPLLHYWSLGVEEQFYLVWPAILIIAARGRRPRLGAGVALTVLLVASYAGALYLTDVSAPWAFYSLPTRAWQLALGGLLAVTLTWHERLPDWLVAPLGWLGLAAIVAAVVVIDPSTPYPGLAALLPSLGAGAVVLAGRRRWSAGALLARAPLRFLGRISYSLYLVHWPILILPAATLAIGDELPLEVRIGLALASVVVATASYRWIEEPFHRGRRLALPAGRTLALAGAAIAATVVFAAGVRVGAERLLDEDASVSVSAASAGPLGDAGAGPVSESGVGPVSESGVRPESAGPATGGLSASRAPAAGDGADTDGSEPLGAQSDTSAASPPHAPEAATRGSAGPAATDTTAAPATTAGPAAPAATAVPSSGDTGRLPPGVRPSLRNASNDWERLMPDGCLAQELQVRPPNCVYGDPHGDKRVALVGDSHASQWFPALERIAIARGWRLLPFTKLSCRFVDMRIYSRVLKREYTECEAWRNLVVERLQSIRPDLVIVAAAGAMQPMLAADNDPVRQGKAMARLLQRIPGRIVVMVDTPQSQFDVPSCLSRHTNDVTKCTTPRRTALTSRHLLLERAAAQASDATLVDLTDQICPGDPCPAVLNGMIVYRGSFHLTATFSASLAGALESALPGIDEPPPGSPSPTPDVPSTPPAEASEPAPGSPSPATDPPSAPPVEASAPSPPAP